MKKDKKAKRAAKLLLRSKDQIDQRNKYSERIIQSIFSGSPEIQLESIKVVLGRLEAMFWRDPATKSTSDKFIRELCAELFRRNQIDFFIEHVMEAGYDDSADRFQAVIDQNKEKYERLGMGWLFVEAYRFIGESVDRSVAFALQLLKHIGEQAQKVEQNVVHVQEMMNGLEDPVDLSLVHKPRMSTKALMTMKSAAFSPSHRNAPIKRWLECLIEHVNDRADVAEVFDSVLSCIAMSDPDFPRPVIQPLMDEEHVMLYERMKEPYQAQRIQIEILQASVLHVTLRHFEMIKRWDSVHGERAREENRKGARFLEEFERRLEAIQRETAEHFERALREPTHGLRANSEDYIEIGISALQNVGIRGIVFHPEQRDFQNPLVEVITRKETPHLVSYRIALQNPDQFMMEEIVFNGIHHKDATLQELLRITILDSYARMVLNERHLQDYSGKRSKGAPDSTSNHALRSVRPRTRALPQGAQASSEAIERCVETLGYQPPLGRTFVRAYSYQGRIMYDLPTTPFAVYRDDDIMDLAQGVNQREQTAIVRSA